jgi:hypothetical protein
MPDTRRNAVGSIDARGHAFVIRIWLERAGQEKAWRGYIMHIITEERHHFEDLTEIVRFIQTHLERDGAAGEQPKHEGS